jgi:hypothetical protein
VRAPKEVLHELQFFVKLLHDGVYGAEFVEQSQTPPKVLMVKLSRLCRRCSPYLIVDTQRLLALRHADIIR